MVSTATEDAAAGAAGTSEHDSSKSGAARKAASRKARSGKKSPGKKTLSKDRQTDGGSTDDKPEPAAKQAAGESRTNVQQQPEPPAGIEADSADTMTATDKPAEDSRSISWMSAQAVSALNAVKANQAKKAESLLARVEKPVPGKAAITELPEQTSEDLLEEFTAMEAAAPLPESSSTIPEPMETSPGASGETPAIHKETTVMQDKPDEQESVTTDAAGNTAGAEATASTEPATTASTEAVIAAQAQPRGLPVRPIVMTVFLALLAFGGYRYWQENRDTGVTPPPVAGSYQESTQGAAWDDIPQQDAIAVVGTASGEQAAPAATTPGNTDDVAQSGTTATNEPAETPAAEPPVSASQVIPREPDTTMAGPAADAAPPVERVETETAEPAESTASVPPPAKPATVVTQPARPTQPQPGYGAPGYGYYPPQRNWQQPYYQPAYPQQYPAR